MDKQLKLDLKKHNSQYPGIKVHEFKAAHDRFLILDETQLYHFGASLKELNKKWVAFSRMDSVINGVLQKLKKGGSLKKSKIAKRFPVKIQQAGIAIPVFLLRF